MWFCKTLKLLPIDLLLKKYKLVGLKVKDVLGLDAVKDNILNLFFLGTAILKQSLIKRGQNN